MTKYKLSKQELQDHWDDQIRFIQKSIKEFDRGDEKEAQRLATHLRVLFHETQKSKSIFGQLKPQIIFYSSGDLYTPSSLFTSWTLLDLIPLLSGHLARRFQPDVIAEHRRQVF